MAAVNMETDSTSEGHCLFVKQEENLCEAQPDVESGLEAVKVEFDGTEVGHEDDASLMHSGIVNPQHDTICNSEQNNDNQNNNGTVDRDPGGTVLLQDVIIKPDEAISDPGGEVDPLAPDVEIKIEENVQQSPEQQRKAGVSVKRKQNSDLQDEFISTVRLDKTTSPVTKPNKKKTLPDQQSAEISMVEPVLKKSTKRKKTAVSSMESTASTESASTCDCAVESLLRQPFASLTFSDKCDIILKDRPTPELKGLKSKTYGGFERHFMLSWYEQYSWLCGCMKLSKLFCWPCLLFPNERNVWNQSGVDNMDSFRAQRSRHENCKSHISSLVSLVRFGKSKIDLSLSEGFIESTEKHNRSVKRNRYVMCRLISAACYLIQQQLPFSGSDESSNSDKKGNFAELLYMLSETDDKLEHHLQTATVFSGTSSDVQNDIIECISHVLVKEIKKEIKEARFVAVVMDEMTNMLNKSLLSVVFRYVTSDGNVEERFLGFCDIDGNQRAHNLFKCLSNFVDDFNCGEKLVAQTYDGACVRASDHFSVQNSIRRRYKSALFVHCYAHNLDLIFEQSAQSIKQCKIFSQTLRALYAFFTKSSKRTESLDQEIKRHLSTTSDTRGYSMQKMIDLVFRWEKELVALFKSMMEDTDKLDVETRACATIYCQTLLSCDFRFLLLVFSSVFKKSELLSNILQREMFDIDFCKEKIAEFKSSLSMLGENFDTDFWSKMELDHEEQEAGSSPEQPRIEKPTKEMKFSYYQLFYEIIGNLCNQINNRFIDIDELKFLSLMDSEKYTEYMEMFPEEAFDALLKNCGQFFNKLRLKSELSYVYSCSEFHNKPFYEFYREFCTMGLAEVLQEVEKLGALISTVPAAGASRKLSASDRIRSHMQTVQDENTLPALSFLSIERNLLRKLRKRPTFEDDVIEVFSEKNQWVQLRYK